MVRSVENKTHKYERTKEKIGPTGRIQTRIVSHILDGLSKRFSGVNESLLIPDHVLHEYYTVTGFDSQKPPQNSSILNNR